MKSFKKVYAHIIILVVSILIIGITMGYYYTPVGESAHSFSSSSPSLTLVKSVSNDTIKLIEMIFVCNSIIAGIFILMSRLKTLGRIREFIIYFFVMWQMLNISLLIGYVAHRLSSQMIMASLLPHGVIEIPIIMLAAAYGIYLCQKETQDVKDIVVIKNYILWIVIPLFIAAVVEAVVTPIIMSMV